MSSFLYCEEIEKRYDTVLKEISIMSPSFFDSYLDMLESTIKFVLTENHIRYNDRHTCGRLIREEPITRLFEEMLFSSSFGCSIETLEGCIRICNNHKHNEAQTLDFESMSYLMQVFFNLINCYSAFCNRPQVAYDIDYFSDLYGQSIRMNESQRETIEQLKEAVKKLKTEVDEKDRLLKKQVSEYNIVKKDAPPQKTEKQNHVLQFLTDSKKTDFYWGPIKEWIKSKRLYLGCMGAIMFIGLVATSISTACFGLYSTFSLVENIWMIAILIQFFKVLSSKKIMPNSRFAGISICKHEKDNVGYLRNTRAKKTWLKVLMWFGIVGPILNIIYGFIAAGGGAIFILIFELLMVVLTVLFLFAGASFEAGYGNFVLFQGKNKSTKSDVTIVGNTLNGSLMPYEEFVKKTGGINLENVQQ